MHNIVKKNNNNPSITSAPEPLPCQWNCYVENVPPPNNIWKALVLSLSLSIKRCVRGGADKLCSDRVRSLIIYSQSALICRWTRNNIQGVQNISSKCNAWINYVKLYIWQNKQRWLYKINTIQQILFLRNATNWHTIKKCH